MKTLLFIGHPGHELLAYKFLKTYKPDVVFLTKGSGSNDQPRINQSIKLVESLGLKVHTPFEPFIDRQIYDIVLDNSPKQLINTKQVLKSFIIKEKYDIIVGDALEGFNPSHDICRYLINSIVLDLKNNANIKLKNYDFLQEDIRLNVSDRIGTNDIRIQLDENELQQKLEACLDYPEIKFELDKFISHFGKDFFAVELFREINNLEKITNWNTEIPFYEEFGKKRVAEGIYDNAISFDKHMRIIANALY